MVLEQRLQDSLLYIFFHTRSIKLEDVAYPSADEGIQTPDHNVKAKPRSITVAKSSRWKCLWICSLFLNVSASNAVSNTIFPWELERAQKASACMKRWERVPIKVAVWVIFLVGWLWKWGFRSLYFLGLISTIWGEAVLGVIIIRFSLWANLKRRYRTKSYLDPNSRCRWCGGRSPSWTTGWWPWSSRTSRRSRGRWWVNLCFYNFCLNYSLAVFFCNVINLSGSHSTLFCVLFGEGDGLAKQVFLISGGTIQKSSLAQISSLAVASPCVYLTFVIWSHYQWL